MANSQFGLDDDFVLIGQDDENSKKSKRSKSPVFIIIIIVLLLIIAGLSFWLLRTLSGNNSNGGLENPKVNQGTVASDVSSVIQDTPNGDVSTDVGEIISGDSESTKTDQPFVPEVNYIGEKGHFEDDNETRLKLVVEYGKVSVDGKEMLKVQTFVKCAALQIGQRNVEITVNGDKKTYKSPAYDFTGKKYVNKPFAERLVELNDSGEYEISVSVPDFKVNYSDVMIESLEASKKIILK